MVPEEEQSEEGEGGCKVNPFRCDMCGRYLPRYGHIAYVEYGGACEFTPREPIRMHEQCYDKSDKEAINRIAWIKPREVTP